MSGLSQSKPRSRSVLLSVPSSSRTLRPPWAALPSTNSEMFDSSGNCASSNFSFFTAANPITFATENEAQLAIGIGVQNALSSGYTNYTYQLATGRKLDNTQFSGTFDWMTRTSTKVWLVNYVSNGEGSITNTFNLTPAVYVLQFWNVTQLQITVDVERFINLTR